jgi:hypothetical protein
MSPDSTLTAHVSQIPSVSGNMVLPEIMMFCPVFMTGVLGRYPKPLMLGMLPSQGITANRAHDDSYCLNCSFL